MGKGKEGESSTGFNFRDTPTSTGYVYRAKEEDNSEVNEQKLELEDEQALNHNNDNKEDKNSNKEKDKTSKPKKSQLRYKDNKKEYILKYVKLFAIIGSVITLVFILMIVINGKQVEKINNSRITTLDMYERSNIWITDDLILYLSIKDEASWKKFREESHLTQEFKDKLVGTEFNYSYFPEKESIEIKDMQYTFVEDKEKPTDYKVYALASYKDKESGKVVVTNYIFYMSNNHIYNMLAY